MEIVKGNKGGGKPSEQRTATFTGLVYADPILASIDGTTVASVFFAPAARTFWHWHERGQLLHVVTGHGRICPEGDLPRDLDVGDTVWVPPGERHWHGGSPEAVMLHLAVSLGTTNWLGPVSESDYAAGT